MIIAPVPLHLTYLFRVSPCESQHGIFSSENWQINVHVGQNYQVILCKNSVETRSFPISIEIIASIYFVKMDIKDRALFNKM